MAQVSIFRILKIMLLTAVIGSALSLLVFYREDLRAYIKEISDAITLPFKIMKLYRSPPDEVLLMPVKEIQVENIADTWHEPRGEGRVHEGQDIFATAGAGIYSATAGYIIFIGENRLGGNVVFVLGAGGRRYYYAHLLAHAPDLKQFQAVTTETVLGYVGSSGNAEGTPPHLHFGVYTSSGPIDPLPLLKDRSW